MTTEKISKARPVKFATTTAPSLLWLRAWLICVTFSYPVAWVSSSLVWTAPALLRITLFGHRLARFELTPLGVMAWSIPVTGSKLVPPVNPHVPAPAFLLPVVLAATILLVWTSRWNHLLASLSIALLATMAMMPSLAQLLFRKQTNVGMFLLDLALFGVLSFGLRSMLTGWPGRNYWARLGNLFAGFILSFPLLWLGFRWLGRAPLGPYLPLSMAPAALAALLVSFKPVSVAGTAPEEFGWKAIACGVTATLALVAGVRVAQPALERARLEAGRIALELLPPIPPQLPYPRIFFQKGVNFTAEFPATYDSEPARRMLEMLPQYGINAVALVPYGGSSASPPSVWRYSAGSWENDMGLEGLSRVAHAQGTKVFLKPAIWDGLNLEFSSSEDRAKWFEEYGRFIEHYAQLATIIHADLFSIGGEFPHLSSDDAAWRQLVARVRELYPGPLVYAANFGDEFEHITFWDHLDYIGLQEYYPLPDDLSTLSVVERVEAVQRKYRKPVIFTEAGFPSSRAPNREPWDDRKPRPVSLEEQARCYDAVFRAFYNRRWFYGVYWWKVETNGSGGPQDGSLTPWGKPAMDVVKRWYTREGR